MGYVHLASSEVDLAADWIATGMKIGGHGSLPENTAMLL